MVFCSQAYLAICKQMKQYFIFTFQTIKAFHDSDNSILYQN
ncbi:unnamed protein product [Paramecium sonneborni]|uniref:Uncharacterized protein n=1 Tax=Paramecium sonneborni TaxID=65129 RepID=A0A8S1K8G6_9CILI|nr:unnamed protein product [Paramecium sonneborni]